MKYRDMVKKRKSPKLTYEDNWHYHLYKVDGIQVSNITEIQVGRKKYPVKGRMVSVDYSDMGYTRTATSRRYFIQVKSPLSFIKKKVMEIGLDELDLTKVVPTKYTY